MVVHQDDRGGAQLQRPLDHFARIDGRVIDGAAILHLVGDQMIFAVQEEDAEFLVLRARHRRRAIIEQRLPGRQRGPAHHFGLRQPLGGGFDDLEMAGDALAHALDFQQALARRRDHVGEGAEALDQRLGQRFGVAPWDGGEQGQFQQLIIGQGLGAALQGSASAQRCCAMAMSRMRRYRL